MRKHLPHFDVVLWHSFISFWRQSPCSRWASRRTCGRTLSRPLIVLYQPRHRPFRCNQQRKQILCYTE